jgi:hypothetical protein
MPSSRRGLIREADRGEVLTLVELTGVEPATSGLQNRRSPS